MPAPTLSNQAAPVARTLANAQLPSRVRAILEQVLRITSDEMERRLDGMLVEFEQQLFRLADHARNPSIESGYLQTLRNLRLNRADLIPRFMMGVEANLAGIANGAAQLAQKQAQPNNYGGLSLVDENEVDAALVLRDIAQRFEARASLALHLLGQRFGVLAAAPAFDAERIPLGPQALCNILQDASESLQLPQESQHLLLRTFERKVMADYAEFADMLNNTIAAEGVLPALTFVPLRVRPTPVAQPGAEPRQASGKSSGRGRRASDNGKPAPVDGAQPHTGWGAIYGDVAEVDEDSALKMLQELLATRSQAPAAKGKPDPAAAGKRPLNTADLVAALGQIRGTPLSPTGTPTSVGDIKQNVLAQIRQERGHGASLSREDNDTFDLLDMLYERIEREVRVDTLASALLKRLQMPLLQTALLDRGFFVRPQHPARQLLNTVAESGARWLDEKDVDAVMLAPLQRAVDHVVENAHDDAKAFETSNRTLQGELQVQAGKAEMAEKRHVEAARGKEKLEIAKRQAAETIASAVGEQKPPKFVRALLDQAWADVLTLTLLRNGEDSEQWRKMLEVTRRIVLSCCGSNPVPDPTLAAQVEAALSQVGYHGDEAAAIARRLTSVRDADDAATRTELAARLKSRSRLGGNAEKNKPDLPPRTPDEQAQYERVRVLRYGTWIEFVTNQQGDVVRKRMSWYSPVTDNALFVNLRGQRVGEQTLDSLARLLARGHARVVTVERARLVDRAWQATLGALRTLSGKAAGAEPWKAPA